MPGSSRRSTIHDVARAARVSTTTVSRVLNGRPDVAEATRLRVRRALADLGYGGGATPRRHTGEDVHYVTIIAHGVDNEYIGTIVRGILDQLDLTAHQGVLHLTDVQLAREEDYVRIAQRTGSDSLLIVTPRLRDADLSDLMGNGTPYVMIDYYPETNTAPCVRATNWQGMREGTNYLIALGHRRIGFITGRRGDGITEARLHGYRSALLDASLPFDPDLVADGDYGQPSGFGAASALLSLHTRPTAIVASNDLMAIGAIEAARVLGLTVPEDVSVLGFDDLPTAATIHPPLTTIRQPLYEMGRMAAQMVVALSEKRELVSRQIELPTQLVVRASCTPPASRPGSQPERRRQERRNPI